MLSRRIMKRIIFLSLFICCLIPPSFGQIPIVLDLPNEAAEGFTQSGPETAVLTFFAPGQPYVYVKGDFTNWNNSLMNITPDGNYHWKEINNLNQGEEYRYQYVVGVNGIESADPYSSKILDEWNDQYIPETVYPNLLDYPFQANYPVSTFHMNAPEFSWSDASFTKPQRNKLTIYELLIRDFTEESSYQGVIHRLDYLQNLGINAIELMPCSEFDGNESWGYNTNFFMASDKYYGSARKLKELINEAHQRGIAIIMDVVFNHSFGLNPHVRVYNNAADGFGQVSDDSPWLNSQATHPFSIGADYNHESGNTKKFVKDALSFWIEEFHIDGFRFDLSKGFTQNYTLGNVGAWNQYDQSRVNILNEYAAHVWGLNPDTYMILEHLSDNPEEQSLAGAGFLIWGGMHTDFKNGAIGYGSNLDYASYQNRGYAFANLINYMVSHDEERLMYECLNFGNNYNGYNITEEATALQRMELVHAFFLSIPGPKMMWMFDELGYDLSINDCGNGTIDGNCRTANKPVLWEYADEPNRVKLYKTIKALNYIRNNHEVIHTSNFSMDAGGLQKRINLYGSDMNMLVIGNFDVATGFISPNFPQTGTWFNYMTGESFNVSNTTEAWILAPGEFYILTDQQLPTPDLDGASGIFVAPGCTDLDAANYDAQADEDDGSCMYQLTFRLGTQGITVSPLGMHIAGNFQGWDPSTTLMTEVSTDIWEYSLTVGSGDIIEYKYINGNDWPDGEVVSSSCGVSDGLGGYNRGWVTAASDDVIPIHCFDSCSECSAPNVSLTFQVDMNNETISPNGVWVTGNFLSEIALTDWLPNELIMTDTDLDGIYEVTVLVPGNFTYEYKFVNGLEFIRKEASTEFDACGVDDGFGGFNRTVVVGYDDVITPLVCFGSCEICGFVPDLFVDVTFRVDMYNQTLSPDGVRIAGAFQGWDPSSTLMNNVSGNLWEITLTLEINSTYEFKYVNGNSWGEDELIPLGCQQNGNRFCFVAEDDLILDVVCFEECSACEGCTDLSAENYNPNALIDDGSCILNPSNYCGDCTLWDDTLQICVVDPECDLGNVCYGDYNGDGAVNVSDLGGFLSAFGSLCE